MDDQHTRCASGGDDFVHVGGHLGNTVGGDFAAHGVPHIADDDGRLAGVEMLGFVFERKGAVVLRDRGFGMAFGGLPLGGFDTVASVQGERVFSLRGEREAKAEC